MKKLLLFALIAVLSISMLGCAKVGSVSQPSDGEADKAAVIKVAESFGKKLQMVSLLAPKAELEKSMKENYGELVTQELINEWLKDPENAPGRLTSSPWPDRIEVLTVEKSEEGEYKVTGVIIEVTSTEQAGGGAAAKRPITLEVEKEGDRWIIDEVTLGEYEGASLKDFFPLAEGSTWQYKGEGNEYASFVRKVLFVEGDKAQVSEDNGGTVSSSVFEITEAAITRVFFQGEEYNEAKLLDKESNDSLIVLKSPLAVGTKWESKEGTREIAAMDAVVDTPAGKFENCIKVSIKMENSTMNEYYKEGVGLVKREFESEGMKVTSTLEKYQIK
jgi:hypothetical protein